MYRSWSMVFMIHKYLSRNISHMLLFHSISPINTICTRWQTEDETPDASRSAILQLQLKLGQSLIENWESNRGVSRQRSRGLGYQTLSWVKHWKSIGDMWSRWPIVETLWRVRGMNRGGKFNRMEESRSGQELSRVWRLDGQNRPTFPHIAVSTLKVLPDSAQHDLGRYLQST